MASLMKDITEPRETDILCGRGGAALRHAGNQTYRRLVKLNKSFYMTCLKTEKQKISQSIVLVIRDQNGRFLERDANKGVWFDIGDKKAVEKTSQALRDCKLEEKMANQIPAEKSNGRIECVPTSMLKQYGNGIYNARGQSSANNSLNGCMHGILMSRGMSIGSVGSGSHIFSLGSVSRMGSIGSGILDSSILDSMQQQQIGRNNTGQLRDSMAQMPSPPLRTLCNDNSMKSMISMGGKYDVTKLQHDLSLDTFQSIPSWTPSIGSMESMGSMMTMLTTDTPRMISRRPSPVFQYNRNASYGSYNKNNSSSSSNNNIVINATMQRITSNSGCNNNNLSDFANRNSVVEPDFPCEKFGSFDPTEQPLRQQQQLQFAGARDYTQGGLNDINFKDMKDQRSTGPSVNDRRRCSTNIKLGREPNARNMSSRSNDVMSDVHAVDSVSLLLNLPPNGREHIGVESPRSLMSSLSKLSIGVGSRLSLMSGLSFDPTEPPLRQQEQQQLAKARDYIEETKFNDEFRKLDDIIAENYYNSDISAQRNFEWH